MKKVLSLAAAGLFAAGAAQAGTLTVANSDITLYGGISAAYEYAKNDAVTQGNKDNFYVSTVAVGLKADADPDKSPIGFNAAFANFEIPTVIASTDVINNYNLIAYGKTNNSLKPWLAYVTIAPTEGLSIDAGLLWNKFGEAPLTILNQHYTRGILFTGHPVVYKGARVNYDLGMAKVYVGYNQGGGLRQGQTTNPLNNQINDAFEAGAVINVEPVKIGLHTYNEANGRDLYVLCLKGDAGIVKGGIEFDYTKLDDRPAANADDNAWGVALNLNFDFLDAQIANVTVPIRIEYVDNNKNTDIYLLGNDKTWSFTITPTYKPTKNTFARVELAYTKADKNSFVDNKGKEKDNRTVVAFEAGFLF